MICRIRNLSGLLWAPPSCIGNLEDSGRRQEMRIHTVGGRHFSGERAKANIWIWLQRAHLPLPTPPRTKLHRLPRGTVNTCTIDFIALVHRLKRSFQRVHPSRY